VLTPTASMIPAVFSKTIACIDPWVYAISHPKFREAVHQKFPWLVSEDPAMAAKKKNAAGDATSQVSVQTKPE
jgi:r-opsin